MKVAKIQFSEDELQLVENSNWLLTKNVIIQKVIGYMSTLADQLRERIEERLPTEVRAIAPKVSRGEQYQGLPYVILDYPRAFGRENVFAIRTFFWWGNYCSVTLQLKGLYRDQYHTAIVQYRDLLAAAGFHLCITEDEWRHDFEPDHYQPLGRYTAAALEAMLTEKDFCKLSARVSLEQWNRTEKPFEELFRLLFRVLDL